MRRQIRKYLNPLFVLFFCTLLRANCLVYASDTPQEPIDPAKLTGIELCQYGTTQAHYTPELIAKSEAIYYNRPETPFVLGLLEIKKGMTVGDIGCGVGSFTFAIAQQTGRSGKVYAIDIQEEMIKVVKKHMQDKRQNGFNNIIAYVNKCDTTLLPKKKLDIAWVSMVHFHNFPVLYKENVSMIKSIYDALKPGGRLVVSDEADEHNYIPDPFPNIIKHYQAVGFTLSRGPIQDPIVKTTFYLVFTKPKRNS
jgi:SAM-dependent methyltransferase